ncbi:MAG: IMP dehydrogenase [Gemmatimonadetes bacterium]|nr:IMP dehydrogenase [Gemmatimonadota bacterium]
MTEPRRSAVILKEALTFDDVLLVPGHSTVHPRDTELGSRATSKVALQIPLLAAAMDTVTESRMAIQMAREGGMGIIHKNMSVDRQAEEVDRVKRSESGMILNPITLGPDATLRQAHELMGRFSISGVPIVENGERLVGIITNRDLQFETQLDRPIRDVMTSDGLVTVPVGTTLDQAEAVLHEHRIEKLPVVDGEGRLKGLITVKDIFKRRRYPDACKDEHGRLRVGAAVGTSQADLDRAAAVLDAGVDLLVIDTAHGHSIRVLDSVARVKKLSNAVQVIAGNVATADGTQAMVDAGADSIKVGVGPGSICVTRVVTGYGMPQVTAVMEAYEVAHRARIPIIADGGVKDDKDVFLALVCGATSVMMGSALSGTDESPGQVIEDPASGQKLKIYRGMTSPQAVLQTLYSADQADVDEALETPSEGQEIQVRYKGSVVDILSRMRGHLRSAVSYAGARSLAEARDAVVRDPMRWLVPLSEAARRESYER